MAETFINFPGQIQVKLPANPLADSASLGTLMNWIDGNVSLEPIDIKARAAIGGAPQKGRDATARSLLGEDVLSIANLPDSSLKDALVGRFGADNYIFHDGSKLRIYNSPGRDVQSVVADLPGDIASVGPEIAEEFGASLGGLAAAGAGAIGGPPGLATSLVLAPTASAITGTAARNAYEQTVQPLLGTIDQRTAADMVADTGGLIATNIAAEVGLKGLTEIGKRLLSGNLVSPSRRGEQVRATAEFIAEGVDPQLSSTSGSTLISQLEAGLARIPIAASIAATKAKKTSDQIAARFSNYFGDLYSGPGEMGRDIVGQRISEIMPDAKKGVMKVVGAAKLALTKKVPSSTPASFDETLALLKTGGVKIDNLPALRKELGNPGYRSIYAALRKDLSANELDPGFVKTFETAFPGFFGSSKPRQPSVGDLMQLRTVVGDKLSDLYIKGEQDLSERQLKNLYAAVSKDIRSAASNVPGGVDAFERYNAITQKQLQSLGKAFSKVRKNASTKEIYDSVVKSKDPDKLANLKNIIGSDDFNYVSANILKEMGGASGEFSAARFLREYTALPNNSKAILFGSRPELKSGLDRLARIIKSGKNAQAFINNSNTAGTQIVMAVLMSGTVGGGVAYGTDSAATGGVAGAGLLTPVAVSALLFSPKFVRWASTPVAANGLSAHLGRLANVVSGEPQLAPYVVEFLNAVGAAEDQKPAPPISQ